jgi:hypothetical protein
MGGSVCKWRFRAQGAETKTILRLERKRDGAEALQMDQCRVSPRYYQSAEHQDNR